MIDDQELAVFMPGEPQGEPISAADPTMAEGCRNAPLGCTFIGSSINSVNAHARFYNFNKKKAKPAAAAKAAKVDKADKANVPVEAGKKAARKLERNSVEASNADDEGPKKAHVRSRSKVTRKPQP